MDQAFMDQYGSLKTALTEPAISTQKEEFGVTTKVSYVMGDCPNCRSRSMPTKNECLNCGWKPHEEEGSFLKLFTAFLFLLFLFGTTMSTYYFIVGR
jgi:hypothetical protein